MKPGTSTWISPRWVRASRSKRLPAGTSRWMPPCRVLAETGSTRGPWGTRCTLARLVSTASGPRKPSSSTSSPEALMRAPCWSPRPCTPPCSTVTSAGPPMSSSTTPPKLACAQSAPLTPVALTAPCSVLTRASPPTLVRLTASNEVCTTARPLTSEAVTPVCSPLTSRSPPIPSTDRSPWARLAWRPPSRTPEAFPCWRSRVTRPSISCSSTSPKRA